MTTTEVLQRIVNHLPEWQSSLEKESSMGYLIIAEIGREMMHNLIEDKNLELVKVVFQTVEEILEENSGNIEVTSLIGAGMFEAIQNNFYDTKARPDLMREFLPPKSLKFWEDIIEGWTGHGIRTIEDWRRVLVNGSIDSFKVHFLKSQEIFEFNQDQAKSILNISPFMAEQHIGWTYHIDIQDFMGFTELYAKIYIQKTDTTEIIVGNTVENYSQERFVLNRSNSQIATVSIEFLESIKIKYAKIK